ncbi:TadE/TadG family type IV pilus assembly protein [Streptomyces sp. NPDC086783]|uniref:TadE/TadG family type IV pilus assembly protein n=1 Tax=Streptomyces sp. NPDC086783 TaxID=3365758 RepID=UPI0038040D1D
MPGSRPERARRWGDRGVSMLEFAGFLPILLVIGMAAIQLGLVGYGINQAGSGARAAARVAAQKDAAAGQAAGQAAMDGRFGASVSVGDGGDTVVATVQVEIPSVIPFMDGFTAERRATMPNDQAD